MRLTLLFIWSMAIKLIHNNNNLARAWAGPLKGQRVSRGDTVDDKRVYLSPWHLIGMKNLVAVFATLGPLMILVCIVLLCTGELGDTM